MKKIFILLFAVMLVFNGCSSEGETKTTETIKPIETPTNYSGITVTDFATKLNDEYGIKLDLVFSTDNEDGTKTTSYSASDNSIYVDYDNITGNVLSVSFLGSNIDNDDMLSVLTEYLVYTGAIAETIDPNIDIDALYDLISNGFSDSEFVNFEGEQFKITIHYSEMLYTATFTNKNTIKGK
jgi:hypothetical protein